MFALFRAVSVASILSLALAFGGGAAAQSPESDHPPGSFVISAAQDALTNDADGVWEFARWRETPQGHGFWKEEAERLEGGGQLSAEARTILTDWLTAAEAGAESPVPPTFILDAAKSAVRSDPEGLITFVTWSETPQGHAFWEAQHQYAQDGETIYPLAERILEHWIELSENQ